LTSKLQTKLLKRDDDHSYAKPLNSSGSTLLIEQKDMGGLVLPTAGVYQILCIAEQVFRVNVIQSTLKITKESHINRKMLLPVLSAVDFASVFPSLRQHLDQTKAGEPTHSIVSVVQRNRCSVLEPEVEVLHQGLQQRTCTGRQTKFTS
jgi:hypothetical protein